MSEQRQTLVVLLGLLTLRQFGLAVSDAEIEHAARELEFANLRAAVERSHT